jgi:hypothetical protein
MKSKKNVLAKLKDYLTDEAKYLKNSVIAIRANRVNFI